MAAPTELSHRRTVLRVNDEEVTGYPEDEAPIEIESQPLVRYTFGSDGTLFLEDTALQGGEVTIKLGQSSPFIPKMVSYDTRIKRNEVIEFKLSYGDPTIGYSVNCMGGALLECDTITMPGGTFEAKFIFEQIIGDFDGVTFNPPPPTEG